MTKKILELGTGDTFAGEGVGDDFSCAEFPRIVPRINAENDGPHVFTPGAVIPLQDASAADAESRSLTVSVWCGDLGLLVAAVVVSGVVSVTSAYLESKQAIAILSDRTLDAFAVKRSTGFVSLREAIEARAREEAFA